MKTGAPGLSSPLRHNHAAIRTGFVAALATALLLTAGCNRSPQKFTAKGDQAYQQGKYADAVLYYGRAVQLDPRSGAAHFKLAQQNMKSWPAPFGELQRSVELQPNNWDAQMELGRLELAGGRKNEARDRAQLILKANPANADAHLFLADVDVALGNTDEALAEATEAIKLAPNRAAFYFNLSQLYLRVGKPKDAEENLLKSQSLDPKSDLSYMALGALYFQQKRIPEAEKQFKTAIEVAPQDVSPRSALAG